VSTGIRRLGAALKHLDRWREVSRCFQEFERPAAMVSAYLGTRRMAFPQIAIHRSGIRFRMQEFGDLETAWQIFLRRIYDVRPTDRQIVDVGANVGLFACYAAWKAPQARLLAVEPFPSTVERLRENLVQNHANGRVEVLAAALSSRAREVVMAANPESSQQNFVVGTIGSAEASLSTLRVPAMPLSEAVSAMPGKIDLLKMDIEGGEFDALLNTSAAELRRFQRINVEHHEAPSGCKMTKGDLIGHLRSAGFTVRQHAGADDSTYGILHCTQAA
jgi:FkbM family methyltransferase